MQNKTDLVMRIKLTLLLGLLAACNTEDSTLNPTISTLNKPDFASGAALTVTFGDADFTNQARCRSGHDPSSYTSSDSALHVDEDGKVSILGIPQNNGLAVITVTCSGVGKFTEAKAEYGVVVQKFTPELTWDGSGDQSATIFDTSVTQTASLDITPDACGGSITYSLEEGVSTIISAVDSANGEVTLTDYAGNATIAANFPETDNCNRAEEISYLISIATIPNTVTWSVSSLTLQYGDSDFNLAGSAAEASCLSGSPTYSSDNSDDLSVAADGVLQLLGAGEVTITATCPEVTNQYDQVNLDATTDIARADSFTLSWSRNGDASLDISEDSYTQTLQIDSPTNCGAYSVSYEVTAESGDVLVANLNDTTDDGVFLLNDNDGAAAITATTSQTANCEATSDSYQLVNLPYNEPPALVGNQTKTYGDATFDSLSVPGDLSCDSGVATSFSSDAATIAGVDSSGVVTIEGAGTAFITASCPGVTDQYSVSSDSYKVTINKATLTLSYTESEKTLGYGDSDVTPNTAALDEDSLQYDETPSYVLGGGGSIDYISNDPDVADINTTTGEVSITLPEPGLANASHTATFSGHNDYADASTDYLLSITYAPTDFADLALWLDASDDATLFTDAPCATSASTGGKIACWRDKSGKGNHVTQDNSNDRPVLLANQQNQLPALDFSTDATDDHLATGGTGQINADGGYTKFVLFSLDSTTDSPNGLITGGGAGTRLDASSGVLDASHDGGALLAGGTDLSTDRYYITTLRYDGVNSNGLADTIRLDGSADASDDTAGAKTHTASKIYIGADGTGDGLNGKLAELMVYNRAISDEEVEKLECYLARKWDISVDHCENKLNIDDANYPQYKIFQRDAAGNYSFDLSGDYDSSETCTTIEASFNGGAFASIDVSPGAPTPGTWSGTLADQPTGQGSLVVRCSDNVTINDTLSNLGVGDVYVVAGGSNAQGHNLENTHDYSDISGDGVIPTVFDKTNTWKAAVDPTDQSGDGGGSVWPLVGGYLADKADVPVAFITTAVAGSTLNNAASDWSADATGAYADMLTRITDASTDGVKAILWFQGEADAAADNTTDYQTALENLIANVRAETIPTGLATTELVAATLAANNADADDFSAIRLETIAAWDNTDDIRPGPHAYDLHITDGLGDDDNLTQDDEIYTLAFRWFKALEGHYYGGASGRGPQVLASDVSFDTTADTISIDFSADSALTSSSGGSSLSPSVWTVYDDTAASDLNVTSAVISDSDTVTLTLGSALTSANQLTIRYASGNSGENRDILTDGATGAVAPEGVTQIVSGLPADPFEITVTVP